MQSKDNDTNGGDNPISNDGDDDSIDEDSNHLIGTCASIPYVGVRPLLFKGDLDRLV